MSSSDYDDTPVCKYFASRDRCPWGINCRFLHDPSLVPCRFYSSPFGCRYGNNCSYSHNISHQPPSSQRPYPSSQRHHPSSQRGHPSTQQRRRQTPPPSQNHNYKPKAKVPPQQFQAKEAQKPKPKAGPPSIYTQLPSIPTAADFISKPIRITYTEWLVFTSKYELIAYDLQTNRWKKLFKIPSLQISIKDAAFAADYKRNIIYIVSRSQLFIIKIRTAPCYKIESQTSLRIPVTRKQLKSRDEWQDVDFNGNQAMMVVVDGKLNIIGGCDNNRHIIYDPELNKFLTTEEDTFSVAIREKHGITGFYFIV